MKITCHGSFQYFGGGGGVRVCVCVGGGGKKNEYFPVYEQGVGHFYIF